MTLWCEQPYLRYSAGSGRPLNPATLRMEREPVACGRCASCVKNRKQDWAGKLMAEAETSASVVFVTLTYKKEPTEFVYADVQKMLKLLRFDLWEQKQIRVRFFCAGERGERFDRIHWHLVLFFDKLNHGLRRMKKNELWDYWPHGWAAIEVLDEDPGLRAIKMRYCAKYAVKALGQEARLCRPRCSLKPGLGANYLKALGREAGVAGIVPDGKYTIPGIVFSRGHRAGQAERFSLRGVNRQEFIKAWRIAWADARPGVDIPVNEWLFRHDREAVDPIFYERYRPPLLRLEGRIRPGRIVVRPWAQGDNSYGVVGERLLLGAGWSVWLKVLSDGSAYISDGASGDRWYLNRSILDVLDLDQGQAAGIDRWLSAMRGPNWIGKDEHGEEETVQVRPSQVGGVARDKEGFQSWLDRVRADYLDERAALGPRPGVRKDGAFKAIPSAEKTAVGGRRGAAVFGRSKPIRKAG